MRERSQGCSFSAHPHMPQREEMESYRCYGKKKQRRDWEKVDSHYTNCAAVLAVIAYLFTLFPFESGLVLNWSLLPRFALLNKRKAPLSVCERLVIVFAAPRVRCGRPLSSISPGQTELEAERGTEWPSGGDERQAGSEQLGSGLTHKYTRTNTSPCILMCTHSLSHTRTKCLRLSLACHQTDVWSAWGSAMCRGRHVLYMSSRAPSCCTEPLAADNMRTSVV